MFALCLFCAVSDAILIAAGVAGFGSVSTALPWLPDAMALGGAAFLIVYALTRLRAARRGGTRMQAGAEGGTLRAVLGTAAAFTWLNPHVYLDTLALIGAVSAPFAGAERLAYGIGAATASFVFFFSLGYGARLLAPLMQRPRAWQWLDLGIALVMLALAAGLIRDVAG